MPRLMRAAARRACPPDPAWRRPDDPPHHRSGVRGVAAAALLALTALMPLAAQAQTPTTLVSNIGQTDHGSSTEATSDISYAQQFETGSNSGGYTLTEIVVNIRAGRTGSPAFALYTSTADDEPGTKVVDLSGTSSTAGEQSFTPDTATTLSASTKYFVALFMGSGRTNLQRTSSNNIDSGASTGWDIAENSVVSTDSGATWNSSIRSVEIAIKGSAVVTPPTITGVEVSSTPVAETDTYGQDEEIEFTVTFSEEVEVSASRPHFEFALGNDGQSSVDKEAAYKSGSGTMALVFAYTVQADDEDDNGIWIGDEDRTIKFDTGEYIRSVDDSEDADLDHVAPGTQSGHKVDGSVVALDTTPPAPVSTIRNHTVDLAGTLLSFEFDELLDTANLPPVTAFSVTADGSTVTVTGVTALNTLSVGRGSVYLDLGRTIRQGQTVTARYTDPTDGDDANAIQDAAGNDAASFSFPNVTNNSTVAPVNDATLSNLALENAENDSAVALDQTFAAAKESYTAWVGNGVGAITVTPTVNVSNATVEYLDADDVAITDRVVLSEGVNTIKVKVTSGDDSTTRTYTVVVVREASAPTPDTGAVWTANLTVDTRGGLNEFRFFENEYVGALAPARFDVDSGTLEVRELWYAPLLPMTFRVIAIDSGATLGGSAWVLHVGNQTFDIADPGTTLAFNFIRFDLSWTHGEIVRVKLVSATAAAANAAPTAADNTVTTNEDTAHTFAASDFSFSDADADDTLSSVKIVTLPASDKGTLAVSGTAVTANQEVTAADIVNLTYTPPANANGSSYASFTFKVSDGTDESTAAYTMTLTVTAVNDAATGAPTITGTARVGETLSASPSDIADVDGLPSTFTYRWVRVDGGTDTEISGATSATYVLVTADEGKKVKVKVGFTDDGGTAEERLSAETGTIQQMSAATTPAVTSVEVTSTPQAAPDTYGLGEKIEFTVTFSGAVDVSAGRPHFEFSLGGTDTEAAYESGTGTTELVFAYTVQAGDMDDNGIWIGDEDRTIMLDTGEYIRGMGTMVDAVLTHSALSTLSSHKVDGSLGVAAPAITSVEVTSTPRQSSNTYGRNETIRITVTFDAAVTVTGAPAFAFALDTDRVSAAYNADASTATVLAFEYVVQPGDADGDGIFLYGSAETPHPIELDSGESIAATANTTVEADLDHDDRGTQSNHKVDGTIDLPEDGKLRLVGGNASTGRLEVAYFGRYGTVCDDRIDNPGNAAPAMACRIMGYEGGHMVPRGDSLADEDTPIWLDDLRCIPGDTNRDGTPLTTLDQCRHTGFSHLSTPLHYEPNHNCTHEEDLWVQCTGDRDDGPTTPVLLVLPALSIHDARGHEPNRNIPVSVAQAMVRFTVTLKPPVTGTDVVTVDYTTVDGEDREDGVEGATGGPNVETPGADYVTKEGTLTFSVALTPPVVNPSVNDPSTDDMVMVQTIDVQIVDDTQDDTGETFTVVLSNVSDTGQLADPEATGTIFNHEYDVTPTEPGEMTATFEGLPASHGGEAFTFELRFGEEPAPGFSYRVLQGGGERASAFSVTGGQVERAKRLEAGLNRRWEVRIVPDGGGDVTVSLPATADCAATGAICTEDGRPSAAVSATVPATAPAVAPPPTDPFTVRFASMPEEHDGTDPIVFTVEFSKPPVDYGYRTMQSRTLIVRQGGATLDVTRARRLSPPRNDRWEITVEPVSKVDVTIETRTSPACGESGAVCAAGGERLSNRVSARVLGPPGLSVADAKVTEAADATMDFAVTLSRASSSTVEVDYATSEGTATEGSDYTATSGTLAFAPGERAKTVSVPVLDDSHDDGGETFTLTLSNPRGGNAYLADATATGTIENSDRMPQAWLARFGRTVAEQVIDAVDARFAASRRPGVEVSLAGQAIGAGTSVPEDAEARKQAAETEEARSRLEAMSRWLRGETEKDSRAGLRSRTVSERELLTGTSFSLTGEAGATGGAASLWGRGAVSRFDGREGDLSLDGEVVSAMLGADWTRGSGAGGLTAGLLMAHSRGTGGYRGAGEGEVESTLSGVYPYGRFAVNERVSVWGIAGYGSGTLTLTPQNKPAMRTDMALAMGALGVRGVIVAAPAGGGPELSVKSDALAVRTTSEKTAGLAAADAEVIRLRLGLEGSWRGLALGEEGTLAPRLEIGVRHDGGDAETGFGLDLGGGLAWSHPGSGVTAEVSGRGLLTHESRGFRDRGLAGSLAWDPRPDTDRGVSLTLIQTMGASATGGMDALLGRGTLAGLAANDNGAGGAGDDDLRNRRLELRLGYGFSVFGDRFTSMPELGLGLSDSTREYRLGWRLTLVQHGSNALELGIEASRRESANDDADAEHSVGFSVNARW